MLNVARKNSLLAGLTSTLLLSTSLATSYLNSAQAAPENPVDTPQWQAAVHGHYGYCDADVLRQHWETNIDDAKIRLGGMILNRNCPALSSGLCESEAGDQLDGGGHQGLDEVPALFSGG
jgi:hypothetical protein